MRIKIFWVGKTKNSFISALAADYLERASRLVPCQVIEVRDAGRGANLKATELIHAEAGFISKALKGGGRIVALDERGKGFSSIQFAHWFETELNAGTREVDFIIGGAEGLSPEISGRANLVLSLGTMTWTHEMCRVLLLEQIYRSFSIIRNLPYHK